jgi:ribosomal protein RSM22 (predicted rRNA methylase)
VARGSRIHRGLTGARTLVGTRYLEDPDLRREYADEIAPRTVAALTKVLAELYAGDQPVPRRMLDLGSGTGAAGQAARACFGPGLEMVAVDRMAGPEILVADLERGLPRVDGHFDLVVAAHLLGELFLDRPIADRAKARAERVLAWSRALLEEGGIVLLIEPALRDTSRALLAVRDRLLASGLHVVAPCFWAAPCPALARERDWCHDTARDGARRVDFSYLALRADGRPEEDRTLFRIVSDPLVEKGRLKLYGCGPAGRHALVRLDRHASPANAAFDRLQRGDVASIAGTRFARDSLRVVPETAIRLRQVPAE